MCGRGEAGEDTLLGEEETAGADGQECAFLLRVFLLQVGECADETQGFGFGFEDCIHAAAGDDQDVEFGEAGVGFFVVHVGAEAGALS